MSQAEPQLRRDALKALFDNAFSGAGVELPAAAASYGRPGWLRHGGWRVSFIWGERWEYLEYEGEWGLAGDQIHRRLWPDGRVEQLDEMNEFVLPAIEDDVKAAIAETGFYNVGIKQALVARGLCPWDDVFARYEGWEAEDPNPHELLQLTTDAAGASIDPTLPRRSFLESKLEAALVQALMTHLDADRVGVRKQEFKVPGWTEHLGPIDLYVRDHAQGLQIACELKVDDVEWTLWDLLKIVNTFELVSTQAAFLVVAATVRTWASERDCVALFDAAPGVCLRWRTDEMVKSWPKAWKDLLAGGPARPVYAPAEIEVESIARTPVVAYPGYELRTVAVRPAPASGRLAFADGWPIG